MENANLDIFLSEIDEMGNRNSSGLIATNASLSAQLGDLRVHYEELHDIHNERVAERDGAMNNFAAALTDLYALSHKVELFLQQHPEYKDSVLTQKLCDIYPGPPPINQNGVHREVKKFGLDGRWNNVIVKNANFRNMLGDKS